MLALLMVGGATMWGCASYDPALYVYTSDSVGYRLAEVGSTFDAVLQQKLPVILFIHGRGNEPGKSLHGAGIVAQSFGVEGRAVEKLTAYGTDVVLFSWDSRRGGFLFLGLDDRVRPLENTADAAKRFGKVLVELRQSISRHPTHPPLVLVAHSMGAVVLENYVKQSGWDGLRGGRLFDMVILTSADTDNEGHVAWVDLIARVELVYVTVNPGDYFLQNSTDQRPDGVLALGLDPGPQLSELATYIELHCERSAALAFEVHEVLTQAGNSSTRE